MYIASTNPELEKILHLLEKQYSIQTIERVPNSRVPWGAESQNTGLIDADLIIDYQTCILIIPASQPSPKHVIEFVMRLSQRYATCWVLLQWYMIVIAK